MSRCVNVVVLCPNGRRQPVKVSPNSSILQILEEACSKQTINPDDFDLCHYNKPLDLSLPVRFANLPNNALLELRAAETIRKESTVTIGLQIESGERILEDFVPSSTIFEVVQQCLSKSENIHPAEEMEPVCIYMRQKLSGETLKTTTLRSLGLTKGTAVIRLLYRKPEELNDQAHKSTPLSKIPPIDLSSISQDQHTCASEINPNQTLSRPPSIDLKNVFNTNEAQVTSSHQPECSRDSAGSDNNPVQKPFSNFIKNETRSVSPTQSDISIPNKEQMELETEIDKETINLNKSNDIIYVQQDMEVDVSPVDQGDSTIDVSDIKYIGERHAVLYRLDDITSVKKADLPDEFFDVTINDVKYLMSEYKKNRDEMENQPLLTSQQRQQQLLQALSHYRETVIRVYFPEKLVLQAVFFAIETVQDVMDFIRSFLEDNNLNYYLYITPPKEKLNPTKTLLEKMLLPAAVVYFGCESNRTHYLRMDLREKICDPRSASLAASESRKSSFSSTPLEILNIKEENENSLVLSTNSDQPAVKPQTSGKVPKWLKLSKK